MIIHKIDTIEKFESLKSEWECIINDISHTRINSFYNWNYLLFKNLCKDSELFILTAEDDKGIAGIAPLKIQKTRKIFFNYKIASFIGNEYSDWNDFIIARDNVNVINEFIKYIFKNNINEILFNNIHELSPNCRILREYLTTGDSVKVKTKCFYVKINNKTWDYYLKNNTSKKFIQRDLNRLYNKFNKQKWEVIEIKNNFDSFFDIIKGFHMKSQNRKNRVSIYNDLKFIDFTKSILKEWIKIGKIKLFILTLNNTPLSFAMIFCDNNKYYWWQTGFNTEYANFSPTKFLVSELMKKSFEQKIDEFHFMRGEDDYKTKWTKDYSNNYQFRLYNKNMLTVLNKKIKKVKSLF